MPPDDALRTNHDKIREDLVRTAIKKPLLNFIQDPESIPGNVLQELKQQNTETKDWKIPVLIEVNDGYFDGKEKALAEIKRLVMQVAGIGMPSIGSDQNPFYKADLTADQILALVKADDEQAFQKKAAAEIARKDGNLAAAGRSLPPLQVAWYLSIARIWYRHPIVPLIDKSISTVKADAAHRSFLADGSDIVWAVIDSGIDQAHAHFSRGTLDVTMPVQHWDFTGQGAISPGAALTDNFGHGTHVAGIIAGSLPEGTTGKATRWKLDDGNQVNSFEQDIVKIAGMAPSCRLVSLKVLDDQGRGDVGNIIAALDRIQQINDFGRSLKIHGVNLSVGYEFDPTWFACGRSPICVEVDRLVRSGVVVVVAAGNTGYGALAANQRTTGAGFLLTINDPGNSERAITVGSTHRDEPHTYGVSYFSSKGPTGDGRLKPDLVAPGERILSCCSSTKAGIAGINNYIEDSGTSMAAPHVSGVIAAFLSIRREFAGNPEKVKEIFLSTATDIGRNCYFQGRGLVDLLRAIQSV